MVRALWATALALVALGAVSRMKPATPGRAAAVRVDQRPVPLEQPPTVRETRRAAAVLAGCSVLVGTVLAFLAGLALVLAAAVLNDLLRS